MENNPNLFQEKTTAADINEFGLCKTDTDTGEVRLETNTKCQEELEMQQETEIGQSTKENVELSEGDEMFTDSNSDTINEISDATVEQASDEQNECEKPTEPDNQPIENVSTVEMDSVKKSIDLLREGLNQALISLNKKNTDIQLIGDKLDTYKRTVEDKLVNMFFIDIISVIDNIKRISALYRKKDENPGYVPCDTFEFYAADLESILLNNSVEIIPTTVGEKFNPKNQRIIKKIPTDDKSLHGTIEHVFSEVYFFGGRVISPAKISAYFYTEPKG